MKQWWLRFWSDEAVFNRRMGVFLVTVGTGLQFVPEEVFGAWSWLPKAVGAMLNLGAVTGLGGKNGKTPVGEKGDA